MGFAGASGRPRRSIVTFAVSSARIVTSKPSNARRASGVTRTWRSPSRSAAASSASTPRGWRLVSSPSERVTEPVHFCGLGAAAAPGEAQADFDCFRECAIRSPNERRHRRHEGEETNVRAERRYRTSLSEHRVTILAARIDCMRKGTSRPPSNSMPRGGADCRRRRGASLDHLSGASRVKLATCADFCGSDSSGDNGRRMLPEPSIPSPFAVVEAAKLRRPAPACWQSHWGSGRRFRWTPSDRPVWRRVRRRRTPCHHALQPQSAVTPKRACALQSRQIARQNRQLREQAER